MTTSNPSKKSAFLTPACTRQRTRARFGEFLYSYRYGDIYSPRINEGEPLKAEMRSFIDAIAHGKKPKTDGWNGLRVVEVIEAADESLRDSGGHVPIQRIMPRRHNVADLNGAEHEPLIVAGAGK